MKRLRKWLLRIAVVAVFLWAIALSFQHFLLPGYVESRIVARLKAMGLRDASVTVDSVGFTAVHLSDVSLGGEGELWVGHAEITYSLAGLWSGRAKRVVLRSVGLNCRFDEKGFDFGDLANIRSAGPLAFPFDELECDELDLRVKTGTAENPDKVLVLRGGGSVINHGENRLSIGFGAEEYGRGISVNSDVEIAPDKVILHSVSLASDTYHTQRMPLSEGFMWPFGLLDAAAKQSVIVRFTAEGWSVDAPDVRIAVSTPEGSEATAGIPKVEASFRFAFSATPQESRMTLLEPARIKTAAFKVSDVDVGASQWQLLPAADKPLLRVVLDGKKPAYHAAFGVHSQSELRVSGPNNLTADLGKLSAQFDALHSGANSYRVEGTVRIDGSSFAAQDFFIGGISAEVPVSIFGPAHPPGGKVAVQTVKYKDHQFPGITGSASVSHEGLNANFGWSPVEAVTINAEALVGPESSRVEVTMDAAPLSSVQAVLQRLVDFGEAQLGGDVSFLGRMQYRQGQLTPSVSITLKDASYRNEQTQTQLNKVNGTLLFDSLQPLKTGKGQELSLGEYRQGAILLSHGRAKFQIVDKDRVVIERTDWSFGQGGRFTAHAIEYDRNHPEIETELFVEDLNLEDWLSVLTGETVAATGRLYGRVPFRAKSTPDGYKVAFGKGFLYSTPGGGTLRMQDAKTISQLLVSADPRFERDAKMKNVREQLAEALTDFEYSSFRFNLIPREDGDVALQMSTQGKGRGRGKEAATVGDLTVNFNNFQLAANMAMFGQSVLGEGVSRRLEEFFKPVEGGQPREAKP